MNFKEHLKKVSLFSDLNERELTSLSNASELKKFPQNKSIIRNHELGTSLFIIISGRVKIILETEEGKEFIVDILEPPEFFGELALLDDKPRSATVVAIEPTKIIILSRDAFLEQFKNHPDMQMKLLREICSRLRRANHQIESLVFLDVCGRLARLLLDIAKEKGIKHKNKIEITIDTSRTDIANQIGTVRETLSRAFRTLEKMRLIKMEDDRLTIFDSHALEERTL